VIRWIEAYSRPCFPKLVVDPDRQHVLADMNGAGKTTLLDTAVLTDAMLRGQVIVGTFLERQETGRSAGASTLTDLLHKDAGDAIAFEARLPSSAIEVLGRRADEGTGVFGKSHEMLRPYALTHHRAVVILDADWDGRLGAAAIREYVSRFSRGGGRSSQ